MQSFTGRGLRVIVGAVLVVLGTWAVGGAGGLVLAIVGLVPMTATVAGICLFTPLFGYTLTGKPTRPSRTG